MLEQKQESVSLQIQQSVLQQVIDNSTFDLSRNAISRRYNTEIDNYQTQAEMYGMRLSQMAASYGMDEGSFKEYVYASVEEDAKSQLVLNTIAAQEGIAVTDEARQELAKALGIKLSDIARRAEGLHETNPMMGHRGCRLSITYPEIAEMQTRAVIEAAINVNKEGMHVTPEIMIPLVGDVKELQYVKKIVCETADKVIKDAKVKMKYEVGTMIEIPRAALTADKIAKEAEFFSFGTNDLTQMTFGFSRDDATKFLNDYYAKGIFESDPFAHVDQEGVGELMKIAIAKAKPVRPNISLGICGEHGGDPQTIEFCHNIGLTYVSCSPFRVPIARLAAAQAAIKAKQK